MTFDEYQREAARTAQYPLIGHGVIYPTLGLTNEAGEVAGKVKKIFRDKGGQISPADREALKYELGDVLWYLAQIATELDLSLQDVAEANLEKLFSRLERGAIRVDRPEDDLVLQHQVAHDEVGVHRDGRLAAGDAGEHKNAVRAEHLHHLEGDPGGADGSDEGPPAGFAKALRPVFDGREVVAVVVA